MSRVNNNLLFVLALIFFLVSLANLFVVYEQTPSGRVIVTGVGRIFACVRHDVRMDMSNLTAFEKEPFEVFLNYTSTDGYDLYFFSNTSFVLVNQYTGLVNFTPLTYQVGNHSVLFRAAEYNGPCANRTAEIVVPLEIRQEQKNDSLNVFDDTLINYTRYVKMAVRIMANYTNNHTGQLVSGNGVYCSVSLNLSRPWMNISENLTLPANMSIQDVNGTSYYVYTHNFSHPGNFSYRVLCNASLLRNLGVAESNGTVRIRNRPPVLMVYMPIELWNMNTLLTGRDLDDYYMDPDDDPLVYNFTPVQNIRISLNSSTHIVSYNPDINFAGLRITRFIASDPLGESTYSNYVFLFVLYIEPPRNSPASAGSGGGGGIAGPLCDELWECTDWSECKPNDLMVRSCTDVSECETNRTRPNESQSCIYTGLCMDRVKNCHHGLCEEMVDCGGPCPPCMTCSDGIQNQGEDGIDCGGPCTPCPTCSDGIQNQGETGVDCGGTCPACTTKGTPQTQMPAASIGVFRSAVLLAGLLTTLCMAAVLFTSRGKIRAAFKFLAARIKRRLAAMKKERQESYVEITLRRLSELEGQLNSKELAVLIREFSLIRNYFFKYYLNVTYEFTQDELLKELGKAAIPAGIKATAIEFTKKFREMEYTGRIGKPEVKAFIIAFRDIVQSGYGAPPVQSAKSTGILAENLKAGEAAISSGDYEKAVAAYQAVSESYDKLSDEEKRKFYGQIIQLYQKINNRVSLTKQ